MSRYNRVPPDTSRMTSLKVDGISSRTMVGDLEHLFEKYGRIGDIYIPKEKNTGDNRGFAFVRFFDKHDAEDAVDSMDGRSYEGRELKVQLAKYDRSEKRSRSRSRDHRRSRSRSRGGYRRSRSRSRDRRKRSRSRSGGRRRRYSRSRSRSKQSKSSKDSRSRSRS